MNIEMISTGDEVLCGYITDTNATFLSSELLNIGIKIRRRTTVGDSLEELVKIFSERSTQADIVIVNGGMGPTSDDLSRQAAAKAAGVEIETRPELVDKMKQWFSERGRSMSTNNLVQAELPIGAEIIDNDIGTACGFRLTIGNAIFIFTPGVPSEFKKMVNEQIIPWLKSNYTLDIHSCVHLFYSFGIGESDLGRLLSKEQWPSNIVLGYRVDNPFIEIKLISENAENTNFTKAKQILLNAANKYIISYQSFDFYEQIKRGLADQKLYIEDQKFSGKIFSLIGGKIAASGTIGITTELKPVDGSILLSLSKPSYSDNDRDVTIKLHDINKKVVIKRDLHFSVAKERLGLYCSFMALDLLRRYLCDQDPYVEYDYVKTITNVS